MKIGLDVAQTCVDRAGCAWHADALARALVAAGRPRGHTFELYHHFGDWINHDPARGTVIDEPGVTAPLRGMAHAVAREFWCEIERGKPLPGRPDVVISFSYHAPKLSQTKLVYTVHDLAFWVHPEFATDATRMVCQRELLQALSRAAGFLFVSEHSRSDFETMLPGWLKTSGRPHALSPGASRLAPAAAPRSWSADAPWLMVGSLEPRKNHAAMLDAYELYRARSPMPRPLVLAGGAGWKSDDLRARLAALSSGKVPVRALGYVPEAELAQWYASAFALLIPSWHEGFGLPLIEALSAGLPAIAARRASLPEVGGPAPRYVDPARPEELAEAMLALEADPAGYAARSAAGLAAANRFSWAATAKSVLEFVERL